MINMIQRAKDQVQHLTMAAYGAAAAAGALPAGVEVKANVETRTGEAGLPVPQRVELEGPYSKELADYITHELNIPPERQVWNEQEN